jgi:hypothetical protein
LYGRPLMIASAWTGPMPFNDSSSALVAVMISNPYADAGNVGPENLGPQRRSALYEEWDSKSLYGSQQQSRHFLAKTVKIDSFLHGNRVLSAWRAGRDSNP